MIKYKWFLRNAIEELLNAKVLTCEKLAGTLQIDLNQIVYGIFVHCVKFVFSWKSSIFMQLVLNVCLKLISRYPRTTEYW